MLGYNIQFLLFFDRQIKIVTTQGVSTGQHFLLDGTAKRLRRFCTRIASSSWNLDFPVRHASGVCESYCTLCVISRHVAVCCVAAQV